MERDGIGERAAIVELELAPERERGVREVVERFLFLERQQIVEDAADERADVANVAHLRLGMQLRRQERVADHLADVEVDLDAGRPGARPEMVAQTDRFVPVLGRGDLAENPQHPVRRCAPSHLAGRSRSRERSYSSRVSPANVSISG